MEEDRDHDPYDDIEGLLDPEEDADLIEVSQSIAAHGTRPKTLSDNPLLDDALILRLTYDLATRMHPPDQIAVRYGLGDVEGLKEYLRAHPSIVSEAAALRSDYARRGVGGEDQDEQRVRRKFLYATEELITPVAGIVADPRTPLSARIDGFKQLQRGAGLDGMPSRAAQQTREQGQPFNLTINFGAGGRENVNIVAEVLEDRQIPSLTNPTTVVDQEDDEDEDLGDTI